MILKNRYPLFEIAEVNTVIPNHEAWVRENWRQVSAVVRQGETTRFHMKNGEWVQLPCLIEEVDKTMDELMGYAGGSGI